MSTRIPSDGPWPNDLMIVGERPGYEEYEQGMNFVGPAGRELWARIWKLLRLTRDDFYVSNLVPVFSKDAPSAEEIRRWQWVLKADLLKVKPRIIITVGYHAARWFLPQFQGVKGDFFHGLAFPYRFGRLHPRDCTAVPVVHSSAALRQPDKYQAQLSDDIRAVGRVIRGEQGLHTAKPAVPYRVGLAGFGKAGLTIGLDTEGSLEEPEAVTLSATRNEAVCVETWGGRGDRPAPFLRASVVHAKRLVIHNAPHDVQVLHRLGITQLPRVDDTMLMAYLLGLPQSLKVLAYRELGMEMHEYLDLVQPIDEANVRATLQGRLDEWDSTLRSLTRMATSIETRQAKEQKKKRVTKKAIAARVKGLRAKWELPDNRVLSGLRKMLTVTAQIALDDEEAEGA